MRRLSMALLYAVGIVLGVVGPLSGNEPESSKPELRVSVMVVTLPSDNTGLLGKRLMSVIRKGAPRPNMTLPPVTLSESEMKNIENIIELPKTEATVLHNLSLIAENEKDAETTIGREPIYWISPAKDNLYRIEAITGPGISLKLRALDNLSRIRIEGTTDQGVSHKSKAYFSDRSKLSIEVLLSVLVKREIVSGAPGFDAGFPHMANHIWSLNSTHINDGETYVSGGELDDERVALCFATVDMHDAQ